MLEQPNATLILPGDRHWAIFESLCRDSDATGNLVQDARYAALAIESGCEWITYDHDFAHFPGLSWRPLVRSDRNGWAEPAPRRLRQVPIRGSSVFLDRH